MSRYSKKQNASPETRSDAMKTARGNQRPGQTKEQTRLIAQGIQKGIDQYKKQHKAKLREMDKRLKTTQLKSSSANETEVQKQTVYRQHWLPWFLLALSWLGAGLYFYLG
ncbi:MAG: DUF2956 domain-containing protein [Gammaproteobacteria bacterium]|jgi:hypothetical protein|nr:DUF2956 domain-containing protein [Gammaproteobacteria bacterium]